MPSRFHLFKRSGRYSWRRRVPKRLVPLFGRSHVERALGTADGRLARRRAARASVAFDALLARVEARMAAGRGPTKGDTDALLRDFYKSVLEEREGWRARLASPVEVERDLAAGHDLLANQREAEEAGEVPGRGPGDLIPNLYTPVATADDWRACLEDNLAEAVAPDVEDRLTRRGLAVPDGEAFARLCRQALTVGLRAMLDDEARQRAPEEAPWLDALVAEVGAESSASVAAPREPAPPPSAPQASPAAEPLRTTEPGPAPGPALPDAIEQRLKAHARHWRGKSLRDAELTFALMRQFFGDAPVATIDRAKAEDFRNALDRVPRLHGKGLFKDLGLRAAIDLADELEAARAAGAKDARLARAKFNARGEIDRLSPKTVNKHLVFATGVVAHAVQRHGLAIENPFAGLLYPKKLLGKARDQREMWSDQEIARLFATPVWTGCHSKARRALRGDLIIRDARFWVPLIGAFAGLRLEEAAQLRGDDVEQVEGVWCLRVRPGEGKQLKSPAATRDVPVHPALLRAGLVEHARRARAAGERRLWPELERGGPFGLYGYRLSKWFTEYRRAVGLYEPRKDFHSLRHTFATHLRRRGVAEDVRASLLGHALRGETAARYGKEVTVHEHREAVERIDHGAALGHLFVGEAPPA